MKNPSLRLNYLYSVFYQILSFVVPLFTIPYVSRVFGAEKLGVYSYTNTIAQYFVFFAMLGMNNYGVRTIAKIRENKNELNAVFSQLFIMQLLCGLVSILAYFFF